MRTSIKIVILVMLSTIVYQCKAQKKPKYITSSEITNATKKVFRKELNTGNLKKWASENDIKGSYSMDVTIGGKKSDVITVMAVQRDEKGTINSQNKLKNYIKQMRMPFKIPKGKNVKIRYKFNF